MSAYFVSAEDNYLDFLRYFDENKFIRAKVAKNIPP